MVASSPYPPSSNDQHDRRQVKDDDDESIVDYDLGKFDEVASNFVGTIEPLLRKTGISTSRIEEEDDCSIYSDTAYDDVETVILPPRVTFGQEEEVEVQLLQMYKTKPLVSIRWQLNNSACPLESSQPEEDTCTSSIDHESAHLDSTVHPMIHPQSVKEKIAEEEEKTAQLDSDTATAATIQTDAELVSNATKCLEAQRRISKFLNASAGLIDASFNEMGEEMEAFLCSPDSDTDDATAVSSVFTSVRQDPHFCSSVVSSVITSRSIEKDETLVQKAASLLECIYSVHNFDRRTLEQCAAHVLAHYKGREYDLIHVLEDQVAAINAKERYDNIESALSPMLNDIAEENSDECKDSSSSEDDDASESTSIKDDLSSLRGTSFVPAADASTSIKDDLISLRGVSFVPAINDGNAQTAVPEAAKPTPRVTRTTASVFNNPFDDDAPMDTSNETNPTNPFDDAYSMTEEAKALRSVDEKKQRSLSKADREPLASDESKTGEAAELGSGAEGMEDKPQAGAHAILEQARALRLANDRRCRSISSFEPIGEASCENHTSELDRGVILSSFADVHAEGTGKDIDEDEGSNSEATFSSRITEDRELWTPPKSDKVPEGQSSAPSSSVPLSTCNDVAPISDEEEEDVLISEHSNLHSSFNGYDVLQRGNESSCTQEPEQKDAAVEDSSTRLKSTPIFKDGDSANYVKNGEEPVLVEIKKVHYDDDLQPYYTISLPDGREKQTDDAHLNQIDISSPNHYFTINSKKARHLRSVLRASPNNHGEAAVWDSLEPWKEQVVVKYGKEAKAFRKMAEDIENVHPNDLNVTSIAPSVSCHPSVSGPDDDCIRKISAQTQTDVKPYHLISDAKRKLQNKHTGEPRLWETKKELSEEVANENRDPASSNSPPSSKHSFLRQPNVKELRNQLAKEVTKEAANKNRDHDGNNSPPSSKHSFLRQPKVKELRNQLAKEVTKEAANKNRDHACNNSSPSSKLRNQLAKEVTKEAANKNRDHACNNSSPSSKLRNQLAKEVTKEAANKNRVHACNNSSPSSKHSFLRQSKVKELRNQHAERRRKMKMSMQQSSQCR